MNTESQRDSECNLWCHWGPVMSLKTCSLRDDSETAPFWTSLPLRRAAAVWYNCAAGWGPGGANRPRSTTVLAGHWWGTILVLKNKWALTAVRSVSREASRPQYNLSWLHSVCWAVNVAFRRGTQRLYECTIALRTIECHQPVCGIAPVSGLCCRVSCFIYCICFVLLIQDTHVEPSSIDTRWKIAVISLAMLEEVRLFWLPPQIMTRQLMGYRIFFHHFLWVQSDPFVELRSWPSNSLSLDLMGLGGVMPCALSLPLSLSFMHSVIISVTVFSLIEHKKVWMDS